MITNTFFLSPFLQDVSDALLGSFSESQLLLSSYETYKYDHYDHLALCRNETLLTSLAYH